MENIAKRYPEAYEFLRAKKVNPGAGFDKHLDNLEQEIWYLSRLREVALIEKVKKSLEEALANGESFATWRNNLPLEALQLPKNYQELVFRNAMQNSYNGAKWAHFRDNPKRRILRYVAVSDGRTRHAHKALHGFMADVDDPRWQSLAPSNGHNCRCTLMALTEKEAQAFGYQGYQDTPTWTDKNGVSHRCEPDKGWDYSPENSKLSALLREKEQKLGLKHRAFENEALPNLPLSTELKEKLLKSATKIADFSGIKPDKSEFNRLLIDKLDGKPKVSEAMAAAQYQIYYGVKLERPKPEFDDNGKNKTGFDYWVTETGERLDFMYTMYGYNDFKIGKFNENFKKTATHWKVQEGQIKSHLAKADIIPLDLRYLNYENIEFLVDYLLSLPHKDKEKFVLIFGEPYDD